MDVCDGSVELGKIVRAESEYAPFCIKFMRLGMGARGMASGRKPSMDRISTRRARGAGVGVRVCVGVVVNVGEGGAVAVEVGVAVAGCVPRLSEI